MQLKSRRFAAAACAWTLLLFASVNAGAAPNTSQSAAAFVKQGAEALGGMDRVRSTKNITLVGYGQYAYMFGGGRITASPNAPEKYQAANDLRRIYDVENGRFQQLERRNMLFPFLGLFGHSYMLNNQILDGDIAYDVMGDKTLRAPRWSQSPLQLDGVHMRRMWMLNNPVVLVRTALDDSTTLSAPRREGEYTVVDLTLKEGDKLSAGFSIRDHRPAFVRWSNPFTDLGRGDLHHLLHGLRQRFGVAASAGV